MILPFTDPACQDVGVAGGKGASLAAATAQGLPVPPGYVVCSSAFEEAVGARADELRELARAHDCDGAMALVAELGATRSRRGVRRARGRGARGGALERRGRGFRGGELRRPAGDLPGRARCRHRGRARRRLLGVVLQRARALLPLAQGLARRPAHGGRDPADGGRGRLRRALHDRPGRAPPRPDGRGGRVRPRRAGGVRRDHARQLHDQARRQGQAPASSRSRGR